MNTETQTFDTIVVGAGQAGLSTGYYLKQHSEDFVILDASDRLGDVWRNRWDSLHLFTPARYSSLPGMPFPAPSRSYPPKDQMAAYLEDYAAEYDLPVQTGVKVDGLARNESQFIVSAGAIHFKADNVIVAMGSNQLPNVPSFASELDSGICQFHSSKYLNPSQLQEGEVLVVGAGNSGAEIALDVANEHQTWLSGRHTGHVPFDIKRAFAQFVVIPLILRVIGYHLLTIDTLIGRKVRPKILSEGAPLIRHKPKDIKAADIERLPRVVGVQDGLPVVEGGDTVEVANIIWCTGYRPDFSWINLPVFGGQENPIEPEHHRGVVSRELGLYFVGLIFLYSLVSSFITGVGRDAKYVVNDIIARAN